MSTPSRRYGRHLATMAVALPVAVAGLPAHAAAAAFPASAITVNPSESHVVPGTRAEIHVNLEVPHGVDPGPVEVSMPLTGLPDGFELTTISGAAKSCQIDRQNQRAGCTGLVFLSFDSDLPGFTFPGSSWVTLGLQVTPGLSRDVDWSGVPVTVSTATESAVSNHDLATTRL